MIYDETTCESAFAKIHPIIGPRAGIDSGLSSGNKENKLKDRTNELNLISSSKIRDLPTKEGYQGNRDEPTLNVERACTKCLAVEKVGKIVHAAFCSHFKKPILERPTSSQRIFMPGKISLRLSSFMRPKESGVWQ